MDADEFREAAKASVDDIVDYFTTLSSRPVVSTVEPGYLRKILPSAAPTHGETWQTIKADLESKIMPGITHWTHPNFHAFFPCAASYPSILGELWSAALSGACFNWICSPAVTELETVVLDWLAQLLGLPECFLATGPTRGGGVIQGSASEAGLTAMAAARDKYIADTFDASAYRDDEDAREDALALKKARMVALASAGAHSLVQKSAKILGIRYMTVPVRGEDGHAMTAAGLRAVLERLRARGLEPFFLMVTLGTTDVCAVDDFVGIADLLGELYPAARGGEPWVHVDAAYAGSALVLPSVQKEVCVDALARFHSFDMNMHKWLLTNFDASCLYVRDRSWLVAAMSVSQVVLANKASEGGLVTDYREWQVPLGRRFRSLKVWFVLRAYGAEGLQAYIQRGIDRGEDFAGWLRGQPELFDVLAGPRFSLTVFAVAGRDDAQRNERTRRLCERANGSGRMWVTSTVVDGRFAIRLHCAVESTQKEHVEGAFKLLTQWAEEIVQE